MGKNIRFFIIGLTGPLGAGCSTLAQSMKQPSSFINRYGLYEKVINQMVDVSNQLKKETDEDKYRDLHHQLIELYKDRACLEVLSPINNIHFTYITMSSIIIKLVVEHMTTPQYSQWEKENKEIAKILVSFKETWANTLEFYNKNKKNFHNLTNEQSNKINEMLNALILTRKQITDLDMSMYFNKQVMSYVSKHLVIIFGIQEILSYQMINRMTKI